MCGVAIYYAFLLLSFENFTPWCCWRSFIRAASNTGFVCEIVTDTLVLMDKHSFHESQQRHFKPSIDVLKQASRQQGTQDADADRCKRHTSKTKRHTNSATNAVKDIHATSSTKDATGINRRVERWALMLPTALLHDLAPSGARVAPVARQLYPTHDAAAAVRGLFVERLGSRKVGARLVRLAHHREPVPVDVPPGLKELEETEPQALSRLVPDGVRGEEVDVAKEYHAVPHAVL